MHRFFDPLVEEASGLGAGLDWKTSLQELTATLGLGVPDYQVSEVGPDHEKTFTADMETSRGTMTIEFTRAWAPAGVDRFYNLARAGYFDNSRLPESMKRCVMRCSVIWLADL